VVENIGAVAAGPFDRFVRPRSRSPVRHAAALVAVGIAVAVLELRALDLDHGTHLLVALTLVIGIALLFGPGPATTAFAVGGIVASVASAVTVPDVFVNAHAYVQLGMYLLAGGGCILLVATAIRSRQSSTSPPTPAPATVAGPPDPIEPLTAREVEVLHLAAIGISVEEIARRLVVSTNTVKTHLTHTYAKLGVRGRSDAIRVALHFGYLTPFDICPHLSERGTATSPIRMTSDRRNG
jgi:DNA-binding CsgD family transcriptional regulator/uncharacterized membrane protein YqjE